MPTQAHIAPVAGQPQGLRALQLPGPGALRPDEPGHDPQPDFPQPRHQSRKCDTLFINRLGRARSNFEAIIATPPKTFHDYPNSYAGRQRQASIWLMSRLNLLPESAYAIF
jgi:hypothetical protein